MPERYTPIKSESLFPRSAAELEDYMEVAQYEASRDESGVPQLTDFSQHSPVVALNQGTIFALLELYHYGNRLPDIVSIAHLRNAGVFRRAGSYATVQIQVTLSEALNSWTLSAGFIFKSQGGYRYQTTEPLTIQNGFQGTVTAIAIETGTAYNVPAHTITQWTQARTYLQSATNPEPAAGGADEESDGNVRARGFAQLRDRNVLITEDDFTRFARQILGEGAAVKVVGRLGADRVSIEAGVVHVFALNPDGAPLTSAQVSALEARINSQVPVFLRSEPSVSVASRVYVSSLQVHRINVSVIGTLVGGDNPSARANEINAALESYLSPGNLEPGKPILLKELEFQARQQGIAALQSIIVSHYDVVSGATKAYTSDIPLPYVYSVSQLRGSTISLVDSAGRQYISSYGEGDPD